MALGVLNNLSAIYAENNLNNTNASLQTVLQQLSSGSQINSGADDAAGLSLVNGLAANSAALTQSETNATEGVGLLQVADGALSQVTSLINRAITLATEASNGTLNSTQEAAANQEYQSILSEVNNIGSTTTFNQQQVFNDENVAIYTGDSSTTGSSIDDLYIRSLSEASVGDSGGAMSYSSGQDSVFLNLSTASANAATTDSLNPGQTTVNVNYLLNGANGAKTAASTQISVGGTTGYSDTVSGLISAINDAGLGLTATFATQAEAGVTGGGSETGIEITGGLVSAGFTPGSASTSGTLDLSGLPAGATLAQGATVTINQGSTSHTFTIDSNNNTLATLAAAIKGTSGLGVTATVVTNGNGTQSLSLADSNSTGGALSVTTTASIAGNSPAMSTVSTTTGTAAVTAVPGSYTVGVPSVSDTDSSLTGSFVVTVTPSGGNGAVSETFVMGGSGGADGGGTGSYNAGSNTFTVNGNSLTDLMDAINAQTGSGNTEDLGVTAALGTNGTTAVTLTGATGSEVSIDASDATYTNTVSGVTPAMSSSADANVTSLNVAQDAAGTDSMTGSLELLIGSTDYTFVMGSGTDDSTTNTYYTGNLATDGYSGSDSVNSLAGLSDLVNIELSGVASSSVSSAGLKVQASTPGTSVTEVANTLANTNATIGFFTPTLNDLDGVNSTGLLALVNSTGSTITGTIDSTGSLVTDSTAALSGQIVLTNGGVTDTFVMGGSTANDTSLADGANTIYTGASTLSSLVTAINNWNTGAVDALDLTASTNLGPGGGIYLQSTAPDTTMSMGASTLAVEQPAGAGSAVAPVTAVTGSASTLSIGTGAAVNVNDVLTGSITIANTPAGGAGAVSETFVMGSSASNGSGSGTLSGTTFTVNGDTLADLDAAISSQTTSGANSLGLGLTALAGSLGLSLSTSTHTGSSISVTGNSLVDTAANLSYTATSAYNVGISGSIVDTTTGQSAATFVSDAKAGSGIATISYSDGSGEALSGTDLLNTSDAEIALNDLNAAISDVAAQDGYVGAQINTLNAISQVMSTQQENVVSAQNAVQATDYAAATSNMSKYEILSQTGIAALAQANSVQQEVLKLLQ